MNSVLAVKRNCPTAVCLLHSNTSRHVLLVKTGQSGEAREGASTRERQSLFERSYREVREMPSKREERERRERE